MNKDSQIEEKYVGYIKEGFYETFKKELPKFKGDDPATFVLGECMRAAKRAEMKREKELSTLLNIEIENALPRCLTCDEILTSEPHYCKLAREENGQCRSCGIRFHDCSKQAIYCPKHSIENRHSTQRSREWKEQNKEHYQEQQRQYLIKKNLLPKSEKDSK